jgi:Transport and Golgi organisation 2
MRQLMCTISFVPNPRGFYLAMNRDEKFTRAAALPPAIVELVDRRAIFPREPEVGTWIATNDAGVCLALVNWHRIEREPVCSIASRGQIIKALAAKSSAAEIGTALAALTLRQLRPFRLIAIIPSEKNVIEWRWDLDRLVARKHAWARRHWFSSGLDEAKAERERGRICKAAQTQKSEGRLDWLRRLHRSHSPERGPFSICMHRPDAATVSYTEVAVFKRRATMRYKPGPCCSNKATAIKTISLPR